MGRGHGSTRAGGASRGGGGAVALGGGGVAGFQSAESVQSKAFEDNKFRVGVTASNGLYQLTTTNAPLEGGGKQTIQTFHGSQKEIMNIANALKSGKTLNWAHEHRYD